MADDFVKVAQIEDLPLGATKSVEVDGELVWFVNNMDYNDVIQIQSHN